PLENRKCLQLVLRHHPIPQSRQLILEGNLTVGEDRLRLGPAEGFSAAGGRGRLCYLPAEAAMDLRVTGTRATLVLCAEESSLNWPTSARSCTAMSASSLAAFCDSWALLEVPRAASATPSMLREISEEPFAASAMLRVISFVVALCSSTAVAM